MTAVLQVLNGLTIGAIYILLASGLTIVFGLQGIVNIAHGVFYMLGAYLAITLYPRIGFALTVVAVFVVTALDLTEQDRRRLNVGIEKILSKAHFSTRDLAARIKAALRESQRAAPSPEVVS